MDKIKKLNLILDSVSYLNDDQYIKILTFIKEDYEEEFKRLKDKYRKIFKKVDTAGKKTLTKLFKVDHLKLKLKYFPSYAKTLAKKKGNNVVKSMLKHKKPLGALALASAALGGYAIHQSQARRKEVADRLGIK